MELRLSCTNLSKWYIAVFEKVKILSAPIDEVTDDIHGPLLLTKMDFSSCMDKGLHPFIKYGMKLWISNFIPHFTQYVNAYPCWD